MKSVTDISPSKSLKSMQISILDIDLYSRPLATMKARISSTGDSPYKNSLHSFI